MTNSKLSDGVAKSWEDPEVRRKRLERHAVLCNGERFPSFSAAMKHFKIPDPSSKHIKIRGRLTSGKSPQETWIHEGREYVFKLADPAGTIEQDLAEAERPSVTSGTLSEMNTPPLNQILYGPPGTGKTYHTIDKALEILDPEFAAGNQEREARKRRFDEWVDAGHIAFVTFHQSFSYEDFVEGLRAKADNEQLSYAVECGVFKALCERAKNAAGKVDNASDSAAADQPRFVLVIDEINRGNISRIFGELITLIEPSKRAGADEELQVVLPYSKDRFSVPVNMHIIGTMNTADRSLAGLDLALRRRFTFTEMPPRPELLDDVVIESDEEEASINVGHLLRVMNQRIAVLLDRDHAIGHAYFMSLKVDPSLDRLATIFRNSILPLLQEYFFEDWQHIRWVLNDHRKARDFQLVQECAANVEELFGVDIGARQDAIEYRINTDALESAEAFWGIGPTKTEADVSRVKREVEYSGRVIRQLESGRIQVWKDGQLMKPVKPHLRQFASELGVSLESDRGNTRNTWALGEKVINAIAGQQ
ncbi:McrB family protein [Paraburkholderia flagellata]|uniref:McrB family protein n=1 Tax=Paraburkholderia flagellata TaxID=2883241 RepID=UPI001F1A1366|nr:AAA family ATPase [Paraburkholderia flagellata]